MKVKKIPILAIADTVLSKIIMSNRNSEMDASIKYLTRSYIAS